MGNWITSFVAGEYSGAPEELFDTLNEYESALLEDLFKDLHTDSVFDSHVHICGIGSGNSNCFVHEKLLSSSITNIFHNIKFKTFMKASGVDPDSPDPDRDYIERLVSLCKSARPSKSSKGVFYKCLLLAFDGVYDREGNFLKDQTSLFTPNDYVYKIVQEFPEYFEMAASIHPYRKDCVEQLEFWASKGVQVVKWLPNSQHMDPDDDLCIPFYKAMKKLGMTLLSHAGHERAVDAVECDQELGNPLKLGKPLEAGVNVIAAHLASEGCGVTAFLPEMKQPNFDLLMSCMEKYDNLHSDLSSVIGRRRMWCLKHLEGKPMHRLLYGSDYPVPSVSMYTNTSKFVHEGFISAEEETFLQKLLLYNPLLFSFACLRLIKVDGEPLFDSSTFQRHSILQQ